MRKRAGRGSRARSSRGSLGGGLWAGASGRRSRPRSSSSEPLPSWKPNGSQSEQSGEVKRSLNLRLSNRRRGWQSKTVLVNVTVSNM